MPFRRKFRVRTSPAPNPNGLNSLDAGIYYGWAQVATGRNPSSLLAQVQPCRCSYPTFTLPWTVAEAAEAYPATATAASAVAIVDVVAVVFIAAAEQEFDMILSLQAQLAVMLVNH